MERNVNILQYRLPYDSPIYIDGKQVESVSFKLLGVMLNDDLSWADHVDYVEKKANSRLYALQLLKKAGLNVKDLVSIYTSFIRTRIEYTSPAWAALTTNQSDTSESIQKRALRIIFRELSYHDALDLSRLEMLSTRRHCTCKQFVNNLRCVSGLDNPLRDIVTTHVSPVTQYNLRFEPTYSIRINTDRFKNFVTVKYI